MIQRQKSYMNQNHDNNKKNNFFFHSNLIIHNEITMKLTQEV